MRVKFLVSHVEFSRILLGIISLGLSFSSSPANSIRSALWDGLMWSAEEMIGAVSGCHTADMRTDCKNDMVSSH